MQNSKCKIKERMGMRFKYKLSNAKPHEYGENDLRAERYAPAREPLGVTAPFFPHLNFAFPSYFRPSSHMISAAATPALRDSVSASMGMYTLRSQAAMTAGDKPCPSLPMTAATG